MLANHAHERDMYAEESADKNSACKRETECCEKCTGKEVRKDGVAEIIEEYVDSKNRETDRIHLRNDF